MRIGPQTLAFIAHARREGVADVYPDHGPLRNREESSVRHERPDKQGLMRLRVEDSSHYCQADGLSQRPDHEQHLAVHTVDHCHAR
jgi:hypothetical protein